MKDNLFDLLLSLFEKTLDQLKEKKQTLDLLEDPNFGNVEKSASESEDLKSEKKKVAVAVQIFKNASPDSTRVFTEYERLKLTKASYQFIMRIASLNVISFESLELIINRLFFSESRYVSLQETKWTIRNTLASNMDAEQQAFLELVLYSQEDGISL